MRPLIILFLVLGAGLAHLYGFEGRLVDLDGQPIADAQVSVLGRSGSVRTDRGGGFRWTPDPKPPFEILVVLSNGQYMAPVLVSALPESGTLEVRVSPVASDRVTVTSGATPNIEVTAASGMTIVGREDLSSRQPEQLVEILEDIPGVSRISEGVASVPAIRGLARGRTLLLIDGGRVSTERRAGPSATFLDPFFLEGVEVARGPGSVAYGSDAFGGVIHARTRRPEMGAPFRFRFRGSLGAGTPSAGAGLAVSRGWERSSFLFQGSFRELDDYHSARGEVTNSGAKFRNLLGRGAFEVGAGLLSVGLQSDQGRDIGRPRSNSDQERFFYPREDSDRFTVSYELDSFQGFSVARVDFFLGSYRLLTRRDTLPREDEWRQISDSDVEAQDLGFRTLLVRPLNQARWQFGIDVNGRFDLHAVERTVQFDSSDRVVSSLEEESIRDASSTDGAVYSSFEFMLSKMTTTSAGVRLSHVRSGSSGGAFGDRSASDTALAGFLSVSLEPVRGLSLVGQVSRGFREPTLSDRYFRGTSARGFVTGNPDLEPESSLQWDFAARYSKSNVHLGVHAYHYRIDDLIERFEEGDSEFFFRNRGRARLFGVELELQWALCDSTSVQLGAQAARGEAAEGAQPLDDVPVKSASLVLRRNLLQKGYVQVRAAAFSRDERPGPTEIVLPGYGVLDAGCGWQFESRMELRVRVRNVLDKGFPVSPDRRAVASPGRSASLTLLLEL